MKPPCIGIRGAGLSGLSVARELLRRNPLVSITIFDTRPRLPHPQRTFCYFKPDDLQSPPVPVFSWSTVEFRGESFERRLDVSRNPYTMIRGDDFFSESLQELEQRGVVFRWSCTSVEIIGNSIRADGEPKSFDAVIDAAFDAATAQATLWQSFAGVWVNMREPSFDPNIAVLMDLQESSADSPVSFLYILPTSERTALIEHTTFSLYPMTIEYHLQRCLSWLERHHPGKGQPGATEYGRIPMGLQTSRRSGDHVVGSMAGVIRPATGYAYLRAQEQARQVARNILEHTGPRPSPYPSWLTLADSLFLRALRNAPEKGRQIMERLLSRAHGDSLIAFLSGDLTPLDALSVCLSVPKVTMIRSLLRI
jgi:lycopene beta-cyclase